MTQATLDFLFSIFTSMPPPLSHTFICLLIKLHNVHEMRLNVKQDSPLAAALLLNCLAGDGWKVK